MINLLGESTLTFHNWQWFGQCFFEIIGVIFIVYSVIKVTLDFCKSKETPK